MTSASPLGRCVEGLLGGEGDAKGGPLCSLAVTHFRPVHASAGGSARPCTTSNCSPLLRMAVKRIGSPEGRRMVCFQAVPWSEASGNTGSILADEIDLEAFRDGHSRQHGSHPRLQPSRQTAPSCDGGRTRPPLSMAKGGCPLCCITCNAVIAAQLQCLEVALKGAGP